MTATCTHHYIIEAPYRPFSVSWGMCRLCGRGRMFLKHMQYTLFDRLQAHKLLRARARR